MGLAEAAAEIATHARIGYHQLIVARRGLVGQDMRFGRSWSQ